MGNRLEEGVCIGCGAPLIIFNEYNCCSVCTEKVKKRLYQLRNNQDINPKLRRHIIFGDKTQKTMAVRSK